MFKQGDRVYWVDRNGFGRSGSYVRELSATTSQVQPDPPLVGSRVVATRFLGARESVVRH